VRAPRLTLWGSFVAALVLVAALLAALAVLVLDGSRRSILASAEKLREAAARSIALQVRAQLDGASTAASDLEREIHLGLLRPSDPPSIEAALFRQVVRNPSLAEATFIHAGRVGFGTRGDAVLAPGGRWQVSVFRSSQEGDARIQTRRLTKGRSEIRRRPPDGGVGDGAFVQEGAAADPTALPGAPVIRGTSWPTGE